jgi:hypothetical protein
MLEYLPIVTNLTINKPAFLNIEDIIMCPECNTLSKLSFLHAILFEKKDGTSRISIQYFCFTCQSVVTIEKEVFPMSRHMHVYSFKKPKMNTTLADLNDISENEFSREEKEKILYSWRSN